MTLIFVLDCESFDHVFGFGLSGSLCWPKALVSFPWRYASLPSAGRDVLFSLSPLCWLLFLQLCPLHSVSTSEAPEMSLERTTAGARSQTLFHPLPPWLTTLLFTQTQRRAAYDQRQNLDEGPALGNPGAAELRQSVFQTGFYMQWFLPPGKQNSSIFLGTKRKCPDLGFGVA